MKLFNCPILQTYNKVIQLLHTIFPASTITVDQDNRLIMVNDNVNLRFSCSANEYKVYIDTYNVIKPKDPDTYYELTKCNSSFRLMSFGEIAAYLDIKRLENNFITRNAG